MLRSFSFWIFTLIGILVLFVKGFQALTSPVFFMDEGYYIGAALRFLTGDIFLTSYFFDKPFLVMIVQAVDIVLFGKTHIGFRVLNVLFYIGSFLIFIKILKLIQPRLHRGLAVVLSLGLFTQPLMIYYGFSSYCEPSLLFFCLCTFYEVARSQTQPLRATRLYFYLTCGIFIKFSALFWWVSVGALFVGNHRSLKEFIEALFRKTWAIWICGILFTILNPGGTKVIQAIFEPFVAHAGNAQISHTKLLWTFWYNAFGTNVVFGAVALLMTIVATVAVAFNWRSHKFSFYLVGLPFLIQSFGLLITDNARTYERYFFIFLPQVLILLVYSTQFINQKMLRPLVAAAALIYCYFGILAPVAISERGALLQPEWGRKFYFASRNIPAGSQVLYPSHMTWEIQPWLNGSSKNFFNCNTEECHNSFRQGRPLADRLYILKEGLQGPELSSAPVFYSNNSRYDNCVKSIRLNRTIDRAQEKSLNEVFLERLRLAKGFEFLELDNHHFRLRSKKTILGTVPEISARGHFVAVYDDAENRYYSGFEFESLKPSGLELDLVDVLPLFYKSYVIKIEQLELPYQRFQTLSDLEVSKDLNTYSAKLDHAEFTKVCGI